MKILGIDYGRRKVGVAIGDTETKLAEPLTRLKNSKFLFLNLKSIFNDQNVKKIIIGLQPGKMSEEVKRFGEGLKKETNSPVEYFDETLTTQDAQKVLIGSGRNRKSRREKEDAVAAAIMLQSYIEGGSYV